MPPPNMDSFSTFLRKFSESGVDSLSKSMDATSAGKSSIAEEEEKVNYDTASSQQSAEAGSPPAALHSSLHLSIHSMPTSPVAAATILRLPADQPAESKDSDSQQSGNQSSSAGHVLDGAVVPLALTTDSPRTDTVASPPPTADDSSIKAAQPLPPLAPSTNKLFNSFSRPFYKSANSTPRQTFGTLRATLSSLGLRADTTLTPDSTDSLKQSKPPPLFERTSSTPFASSVPATPPCASPLSLDDPLQQLKMPTPVNRTKRSVSAVDSISSTSVFDNVAAWFRNRRSTADLEGSLSGLSVDETDDAERKEKERVQRMKAQQKEMKRQEELRKQWHTVLENYHEYQRSSKLHSLCWHGIPSSLRTRAWCTIVGNQLNITQELFTILTHRAAELRKAVQQQTSSDSPPGLKSDEQHIKEQSLRAIDKDIPRTFPELKFFHTNKRRHHAHHRSTSPLTACNTQPSSQATTPIVTSTSLYSAAIDNAVYSNADLYPPQSTVQRTDSSPQPLPLSQPSSPTATILEEDDTDHMDDHDGDGDPTTDLHTALVLMLDCYVCYRPDVGYVQGMSYLAAMILMNVGTAYDSFVVFANLLNSPLYHNFFTMQAQKMRIHLDVYNDLTAEYLPTLHQHFEVVGVRSDMYLYEWLLTIYCRSLPLDVAHRIWDNFLCHGQTFLFRTALGYLHMSQQQLLKSNFEQCLDLLMHPSPDIQCSTLFDSIEAIRLSDSKLEQMIRVKEKESVAKNGQLRSLYVQSMADVDREPDTSVHLLNQS